MNSQIFPGIAENLNRQAHETLLRASRTGRRAQKPRIAERERFPNIDKGYRAPSLLEPAVSFLAVAGLALQVALLVAF